VVVANHRYGILDCSLMGRILSELVGGDFKIMAHQVFRRAPELDRILLRVDLSEAREAGAQHLGTRAEALRYLCGGGGISVFPGRHGLHRDTAPGSAPRPHLAQLPR
jgi:putative hemolysin